MNPSGKGLNKMSEQIDRLRTERAELIAEMQQVDAYLKSAAKPRWMLAQLDKSDRLDFASASNRKKVIQGRLAILKEEIRKLESSAERDYLNGDVRRHTIRANAFLQAAQTAGACRSVDDVVEELRKLEAAERSSLR